MNGYLLRSVFSSLGAILIWLAATSLGAIVVALVDRFVVEAGYIEQVPAFLKSVLEFSQFSLSPWFLIPALVIVGLALRPTLDRIWSKLNLGYTAAVPSAGVAGALRSDIDRTLQDLEAMLVEYGEIGRRASNRPFNLPQNIKAEIAALMARLEGMSVPTPPLKTDDALKISMVTYDFFAETVRLVRSDTFSKLRTVAKEKSREVWDDERVAKRYDQFLQDSSDERRRNRFGWMG